MKVRVKLPSKVVHDSSIAELVNFKPYVILAVQKNHVLIEIKITLFTSHDWYLVGPLIARYATDEDL